MVPLPVLEEKLLPVLVWAITCCVLMCKFNVIILANVVVCLSVMVKLFIKVLERTELVNCMTLLLSGVRLMLVTVEVAAVIGLFMCYKCVTEL